MAVHGYKVFNMDRTNRYGIPFEGSISLALPINSPTIKTPINVLKRTIIALLGLRIKLLSTRFISLIRKFPVSESPIASLFPPITKYYCAVCS